MRPIRLVLITIIIALTTPASTTQTAGHAPGQTGDILLFDATETTLANGL